MFHDLKQIGTSNKLQDKKKGGYLTCIGSDVPAGFKSFFLALSFNFNFRSGKQKAVLILVHPRLILVTARPKRSTASDHSTFGRSDSVTFVT
jgi:hypothetical protein